MPVFGIGPKSALRMALYLLKQEEAEAENLADSILELRKSSVLLFVPDDIGRSFVSCMFPSAT